ncbi:MAG TPA: hypothetical protein VNF06_01455 [Candidatus Aquilonibacter sp.]|nr:hypothetical protein [Candidatus Aquilonibacter sp.]
MQNQFKTPPNTSGLSDAAKSLLRIRNGLEVSSEFAYHVLATMHILGLVTVPTQDYSNSEWFKFFYQNGYSTNLVVKVHGKELGIMEHAALQYGTSNDKIFREELSEIVRFCKDLKIPGHNNTLLELLAYDMGQNVKYGYGSILGRGTIKVNIGGRYEITQHM